MISLIGFPDGSNQVRQPVSILFYITNTHTSSDYSLVKETHGVLLCATSITRFVEGFKKCNIASNGCNVDIVEVSQIIALRSPPCLSKSKMKEIPSKYPNIEPTPAKTMCFN